MALELIELDPKDRVEAIKKALVTGDNRTCKGWTYLYTENSGPIIIQAVMPNGAVVKVAETTLTVKPGEIGRVAVRVAAYVQPKSGGG